MTDRQVDRQNKCDQKSSLESCKLKNIVKVYNLFHFKL